MNNYAVVSIAMVIFTVAVLLFFTEPVFAAAPSADQAFLALANDYFTQSYYPEHPSDATQLGIHVYDSQLEAYTKVGIEHDIAVLKKFESRVARVDSTKLSEQVKGDRELVLNHIRSRLLTAQVIRPWEKNPDFYSSGITTSAFVIIERKYAPVEDRLAALIEREKKMPAALAAARKNIKNPPKILTEISLEQLPGLIQFFQTDVPEAFSTVTDEKLNSEFKASNKAVIDALISYESWLRASVLPVAHGEFRIGATTFRKKLQYEEMVDLSLDQLLAIGNADLRKNQEEIKRLTKEIDAHKTPQQLLNSLANRPQLDQLLPSFAATFSSLISFIDEKKIITIPSDVRPMMEETPPFLRAFTFASMDTPGPFEKNANEAYFNVTLPAESWGERKTHEYMQKYSYPSITGTSVHEAYPGHYVQFLWMQDIEDPVRKILGARTNAEGWAHYCEQMILDEGYQGKDELETKLLRINQLLDALWRDARFIVGIKLHTGKMTIEQAIDFFEQEGFQSRLVGLMEAKRAATDPTYLYYTLGKLQILKLRADVEAKLGADFNLKNFHDDFMRQGYPPIKMVRKAMLLDDSPTL